MCNTNATLEMNYHLDKPERRKFLCISQGRLQYEIRGVAPGSDFFFMEKDTGNIKVARPLNDQTATSYTVRLTNFTMHSLRLLFVLS